MPATTSKPFSYGAFPAAGLVAYFSMEIAINPAMPTYSGGLGVLAGDTLRSAADQGVPLVAFTLVHRKGYFQQHLDARGVQSEEVQPWNPSDFCTEEQARITVIVEDRIVTVRAWRYDLQGRYGHVVPIYLLDTDVDGNSGWDRGLTDHLYGGDTNYRLQQEIVLGMGGARMAHALGHRVNVYHMNEGHAALLTLALLESELGGGPLGAPTESDLAQVRKQCVFTTHTPVPAGHDRFSTEQTIRILGGDRTARLEKLGCFRDGMLNMTLLALHFSRYANGVAMQHAKVSREMFPGFHYRLHHQRCSRAHLDVGADPADDGREYFPPGGATIYTFATLSICLKRIFSRPTPATKMRCWLKLPRAPGMVLNPKHPDAGFCAPRCHLQACDRYSSTIQAAGGDCHRSRRIADHLSPAKPIRRTSPARR